MPQELWAFRELPLVIHLPENQTTLQNCFPSARYQTARPIRRRQRKTETGPVPDLSPFFLWAEFNISKLDNKIATDPDSAWIYLVLRGKLHLRNGTNELAQGDFAAAKARMPESDNQRTLEFLSRAQEMPLSDFNQFWCKSEIEQAKPLIASVETSAFLTEEFGSDDK